MVHLSRLAVIAQLNRTELHVFVRWPTGVRGSDFANRDLGWWLLSAGYPQFVLGKTSAAGQTWPPSLRGRRSCLKLTNELVARDGGLHGHDGSHRTVAILLPCEKRPSRRIAVAVVKVNRESCSLLH